LGGGPTSEDGGAHRGPVGKAGPPNPPAFSGVFFLRGNFFSGQPGGPGKGKRRPRWGNGGGGPGKGKKPGGVFKKNWFFFFFGLTQGGGGGGRGPGGPHPFLPPLGLGCCAKSQNLTFFNLLGGGGPGGGNGDGRGPGGGPPAGRGGGNRGAAARVLYGEIFGTPLFFVGKFAAAGGGGRAGTKRGGGASGPHCGGGGGRDRARPLFSGPRAWGLNASFKILGFFFPWGGTQKKGGGGATGRGGAGPPGFKKNPAPFRYCSPPDKFSEKNGKGIAKGGHPALRGKSTRGPGDTARGGAAKNKGCRGRGASKGGAGAGIWREGGARRSPINSCPGKKTPGGGGSPPAVSGRPPPPHPTGSGRRAIAGSLSILLSGPGARGEIFHLGPGAPGAFFSTV